MRSPCLLVDLPIITITSLIPLRWVDWYEPVAPVGAGYLLEVLDGEATCLEALAGQLIVLMEGIESRKGLRLDAALA